MDLTTITPLLVQASAILPNLGKFIKETSSKDKDRVLMTVTTPSYWELNLLWGLINIKKGEEKSVLIEGNKEFVEAVVKTIEEELREANENMFDLNKEVRPWDDHLRLKVVNHVDVGCYALTPLAYRAMQRKWNRGKLKNLSGIGFIDYISNYGPLVQLQKEEFYKRLNVFLNCVDSTRVSLDEFPQFPYPWRNTIGTRFGFRILNIDGNRRNIITPLENRIRKEFMESYTVKFWIKYNNENSGLLYRNNDMIILIHDGF